MSASFARAESIGDPFNTHHAIEFYRNLVANIAWILDIPDSIASVPQNSRFLKGRQYAGAQCANALEVL